MTQNLAVIQLLLTRGLGPRTLGRLLDVVAQEKGTIEELVSLSPLELMSRYGLRPGVAHGISQTDGTAQTFADALATKHIRLLVKHDEGYPARLIDVLGESSPPALFAAGNLSIVARNAVSFCGSRRASELGLQVTKSIASELARAEFNIVSGYAGGVDTMAHATALMSDGVTTFVLAEGVQHFRARQEVAGWLNQDNALVISEFLPNNKWTVHNAMQRNRTICGLSNAVIIIESGTDGGTFNAGQVALSLKVPLFVIDFDRPNDSAEGNRYFLLHGATGLPVDASGKVDLGPIYDALDNNILPVAAPVDQRSLFPDMKPIGAEDTRRSILSRPDRW